MIVAPEKQSEGGGGAASSCISTERQVWVVSCPPPPSPLSENKKHDRDRKKEYPMGFHSLSFTLVSVAASSFPHLVSFSQAQPFLGPIFSFIIQCPHPFPVLSCSLVLSAPLYKNLFLFSFLSQVSFFASLSHPTPSQHKSRPSDAAAEPEINYLSLWPKSNCCIINSFYEGFNGIEMHKYNL